MRTTARLALAACFALASPSCASPPRTAVPQPTATPHPLTPGAPVFAGASPARMILDGRALDIDPSGVARFLVRARFVDAMDRPTDLVSGGDVEFLPSSGTAQWQTRLRFGGPAAIVSVADASPFSVRVRAAVGTPVPDARITFDASNMPEPQIVARALGPHSVWIGWFPRERGGPATIVRSGGSGTFDTVTIPEPNSSYRDETVVPGSTYHYLVTLPGRGSGPADVSVPREPRHGDVAAVAGKGVWLSFSPSIADDDGYDKLDPAAIASRAQAAGLRSIFLRTTYGPFDELSPQDTPTIDAIVDAAAARGIATLAWTVPRSVSFEDVATEAAAAAHRTARGNGFAGLAVDLERGSYFLGNGPSGYDALASYLRVLRTALGPNYPIVATVEDPNTEHLANSDYPFDAIAKDASALQPIVYWRAIAHAARTSRSVRATIARSYAMVRSLAGRSVPIDVGLQSASENANGAPEPAEISAAVSQALSSGAIGVAFFDWSGTRERAWRAIGRARWQLRYVTCGAPLQASHRTRCRLP